MAPRDDSHSVQISVLDLPTLIHDSHSSQVDPIRDVVLVHWSLRVHKVQGEGNLWRLASR